MVAVRKEQLNPFPIGPAHIYWPNGAPTRKAPRGGIYEIMRRQAQFYKWKEFFPKELLCAR